MAIYIENGDTILFRKTKHACRPNYFRQNLWFLKSCEPKVPRPKATPPRNKARIWGKPMSPHLGDILSKIQNMTRRLGSKDIPSNWAMKKGPWLFRVVVGDEILPSSVGIISLNHKDPVINQPV